MMNGNFDHFVNFTIIESDFECIEQLVLNNFIARERERIDMRGTGLKGTSVYPYIWYNS